MSACEPSGDPYGFISSIVHFTDCQAEVLGSGAWQALALPGSTLSVVLMSFLTIFIAIIGYNLLLGRGLDLRTTTLAFVKIGFVLALTTSWPAYRSLVYNVILDSPSELFREIGGFAQVRGADGTLIQRLDIADQALAQLAVLGPGFAPSDYTQVTGQQVMPPPFAGFSAFALGGSRVVYLISAITSLVAVRLLAGLMLALGPFFIAFLLFDNTRSLFEGWIRVLGGAALASLASLLVLGLQLALLEPWLTQVLTRRLSGEPIPTLPVELLVLVTLFALVLFITIAGCARVARAFRLAPILGSLPSIVEARSSVLATVGSTVNSATSRDIERSRGAAVADVLGATVRREAQGRGMQVLGTNPQRLQVAAVSQRTGPQTADSARRPLGQSTRRQTRSRVTASAGRRDRRS